MAELSSPVDMTFTSELDGSTQHYVLMTSNIDTSEPHDVLIALHGHGSDRWQYATAPRAECKAARDFAAAHRMLFVCPDYRATTSWMGPAAEADLVQLISLLRARHNIRRVFLVGASMGGTAVLIFAALHPELVDGVSSQNGMANMLEYTNFQDAVAASYGGDKTQVPQQYRQRSPELHPEKLTMSVALAVGGKDDIVPPDSVRRLAAQLQKINPTRVLLIDREEGGHETSYEDTIATLQFVLDAARRLTSP